VAGRVDDTIRVHTAHLTNTLRAVESLRTTHQSAE
jgi:hypothetical protein